MSVTGERLIGEVELDVKLGGKELQQLFRIFPGCCQNGILGYDCIKKWGPILLDPAAQKIKIGAHYVPLKQAKTPSLMLAATRQAIILPRSMAVVYGETSIPLKPSQQMIFEQHSEQYHLFMSPRTLVNSSKHIPIRVINQALHPVTIYNHQILGSVEAARNVRVVKQHSSTSIKKLTDLKLEYTSLTWEQQDQLKELLGRYRYLFAANDSDLPGTTAMEHTIRMTNEQPFRQKTYRVPNSLREPLNEKLDELFEADIITPSSSPYASPLVLVKSLMEV